MPGHDRGPAVDRRIAVRDSVGVRAHRRQRCRRNRRGALTMVRRTVREAELLDVAEELHLFCTLMSARLDSVAAGLTSLRDDWEGIAFDSFLERVHGWQQWAEEMTDAVSDM